MVVYVIVCFTFWISGEDFNAEDAESAEEIITAVAAIGSPFPQHKICFFGRNP
jgi:hypothetical protein